MTTAQRMGVYARFAPDLAARAAAAALDRCRISAAQITDLIVVSCTGFSAPGVDVALVGALGLRPTVRRIMIGFMGCFGGITGLRAAVGACAADPTAIALVVCVELCSLHMRADQDAQNHVASALFADGAAAAVVASNKVRGGDNRQFQPGGIGRLTIGASRLIEQGQDWMTWRITDNGFAMTLTRAVPVALRECLADFVCGACRDRPNSFILHPGGPGILDAADEALQLAGGCGLEASRAVLKRFGNMSSATILFALDEAMRHGFVLPALLLAFGPGLTIESMAVLPNLQSEH
jgi:predicted naringenin-chalcone synthase